MKIYIASRFADRKRLRPIADRLWHMGHEVTSSWLNEVAKPASMDRDTFWRKLARKDEAEIASADLLIRDVHTISRTGGADVEFGMALGQYQRKQVWLVGPVRNVFHTLADRHFATWEEALRALKRLA